MVLSCDLEGVGFVDTEITHGVLNVLVSEEKLCGTEIAGFPVDIGGLGAPERMRRVMRWIKPRAGHPLLHKPPELFNADRAILAACKSGKEPRRAHLVRGNDPALKGEPCTLREVEGDTLAHLLLAQCDSLMDAVLRGGDIAHLERYQIASPELAIERQIEEGEIACGFRIVALIEHQTDEIDLIGVQGSRLADGAAFIPWFFARHVLAKIMLDSQAV